MDIKQMRRTASKLTDSIKSLQILAEDMMLFEESINNLGVATRNSDNSDHFRNFYDILGDVYMVIKDNLTIIRDVKGKKFATSEEHIEFLKKYDFDPTVELTEDAINSQK